MEDAFVPSQQRQFSDADLDQITGSTFVKRVEFHQAIDSTNNRALEIARTAKHESPVLVLAGSQTHGRGRGSNSWWAQSGALTFSLLIKTDQAQLPPPLWPQVSLTTGLAVCEAIAELLSEPAIHLKWPNDVYVRQRKTCGILIESPPGHKGLLVIGIGINVNNSMRHAPAELRSSAIALCDANDKDLSLVEVLVRVLGRLNSRLADIGHRDADLRSSWRSRCLLTGRNVQFDSPTRSIIGLCRGIDDDGALVIETADKIERCYAGTITKF